MNDKWGADSLRELWSLKSAFAADSELMRRLASYKLCYDEAANAIRLSFITDLYEDEPMNEKQTIIEPTVGRLVHVYKRSKTATGVHIEGPLAAIVVAVHGNRCISVHSISAFGTVAFQSSLPLRQPGDGEVPYNDWAEWMPEQVKMARERQHTSRAMAREDTPLVNPDRSTRVSNAEYAPNPIFTDPNVPREG